MSACTMNMIPFPDFDISATSNNLGATFASPMQAFVEAVTKLAKLDETVSKMKADAPATDGNQANMWFEVSMRSMMMTRALFVKQQAGAMKNLQVAAAVQRGDSVEHDTSPQEEDDESDDEEDEAAELALRQEMRSLRQVVHSASTAPREQPEPELMVIPPEAQPEPEPEDESEDEEDDDSDDEENEAAELALRQEMRSLRQVLHAA